MGSGQDISMDGETCSCGIDKTAKSRDWHGIPRADIVWHPTIADEICNGCGACINGCCNEVYEWDEASGKPEVVNPGWCSVGCQSCSKRCPTGAITFPDPAYLEELKGKL